MGRTACTVPVQGCTLPFCFLNVIHSLCQTHSVSFVERLESSGQNAQPEVRESSRKPYNEEFHELYFFSNYYGHRGWLTRSAEVRLVYESDTG
jgi:hypothetical protein